MIVELGESRPYNIAVFLLVLVLKVTVSEDFNLSRLKYHLLYFLDDVCIENRHDPTFPVC